MTTTQTLSKARRLHGYAIASERQAHTYEAMILHLNTLPVDAFGLSMEVVNEEADRLRRLADEFYEDADYKRSLIDPDLIDQL